MLVWVSLTFKSKLILHDLLSYFCTGDTRGDLWIHWLRHMVFFLLPYHFKWRLEAFRIFFPRGIYEMSKWSHQPLGLAWEWRLNFVMGIKEGYFLVKFFHPPSFSSENIPLCCIIFQIGTCTTELNLSKISFRALHVSSGRKPNLRSCWSTERGGCMSLCN